MSGTKAILSGLLTAALLALFVSAAGAPDGTERAPMVAAAPGAPQPQPVPDGDTPWT
jgi:hypothetical protein